MFNKKKNENNYHVKAILALVVVVAATIDNVIKEKVNDKDNITATNKQTNNILKHSHQRHRQH